MCPTTFPRNPLRTTSLKATFRLPFNDSECRRSPATSRSGGKVESSRCCTRHIGRDSPNHPGNGKWTSNSLALTFCVIGPALRTSTAKKTAVTAGCALARHSVTFTGTTATFFGARLRLRRTRGVASPRRRHSDPQGSSLLVQGRRWVVVAWKNQRKYDGGWGMPGPVFGRPGADQASSPCSALHDFNGGRTRSLVPPGPRSQRVPARDPT